MTRWSQYVRTLRRRRFGHAVRTFMQTPAPLVFGARWHGYRRQRPASEAQLVAFERTHGVVLPRTYRSFLAEVGNGAAGPTHGILSLDQWAPPGEESDRQLAEPFDPSPGPPALKPLHGAMAIANVLCEHYVLLVVQGPHAGELWHDARIDGLGLRRMLAPDGTPLAFDTWLESWRRDPEAGLPNPQLWTTPSLAGHAVARTCVDLARAGSGGGTVYSDQLACPSCFRRMVAARIARLVVTADALRPDRNPKTAAMAAAAGRTKVIPRQAFP